MQKELVINMRVYSHVNLASFSLLFPEYFIGISAIYILVVIVLITYNVYGLMLQKTLSECIALMLFMTCYLLLNDDLLLTFRAIVFTKSLINDSFSFFTKFILCFSSAIYFLIIANSLKEQKLTSFEYLLLILFSVLGLMLMCSSYNFLTIYLAIELASLSCYLLASFKKTSSYSVESGIKYFITGAISSAFFLLGSSYIYSLTGSINLFDFNRLFNQPFLDFRPPVFLIRVLPSGDIYPIWTASFFKSIFKVYDHSFVELGLTLILFSLFIKLALAPFHLWSLDVYEGSPTSASFFFAVISKLSIFVVLLRICYVSFYDLLECWQFYSLWVGVFSVFVGSFGGLKQRKLKTLLAYSSTNHMGYALIVFSSIFSSISLPTLFFYLIIYIITGLSTWSTLLLLRLKKKFFKNKYNKELGDFVLLKKSNPALAFSFALTMFSTAGIPPMIGFLAKFSVFLSMINNSFYMIALLSILFSAVSTFYYIRIIKVLYFENTLVGKLYYAIEDNSRTLILSLLVFSLIFLFLNPTLLYLLNYKIIFDLADLINYHLL